MDRCDRCPTDAANIGLIIFGFFVTSGVLVFLVVSALQEQGTVSESGSIQKIIVNHLQVASLAQAFPLQWPDVLNGMFEAQGAVSTMGESLINPDCLYKESSAAALFYSKQLIFSMAPFLISLFSFVLWYVKGLRKGTPFFKKRAVLIDTTPKDKCIVTIITVIYMIFPTLCTQAFQLFHCQMIAGEMYLAADLQEPCYEGRHLLMILTLGISQLLVFIVGLPLLMLIFLRRNKHLEGGLTNHATIVRYGFFYAAYKEDKYYWEIILTFRKVSIVALSVFGPGLGTQRQSQMVLAVLLVCISLEIAGNPYKQDERGMQILGRLEIAALFVQWTTMWGGSMIFSSQDPASKRFVGFLSVMLAGINIVLLCWSIMHWLLALKRESAKKKQRKLAEDLANGELHVVRRETIWDDIGDKVKRVRSRMMSEEKRQARTRGRTFDSSDQQNESRSNPLEEEHSTSIQMIELGEGGGGALSAVQTTSADMDGNPMRNNVT